MVLIGLHGLPGAGKDTAADAIEVWATVGRDLSFIREGFSYRMKWSLARIFYPDISMEDAVAWCDAMKRQGEVHVFHNPEIPVEPHVVSFRNGLRHFGTEGHRDFDFMGGDDIWVDALLPIDHRRERPLADVDVASIIDVRFENEAVRIRGLGGQIWEIVRPEITEKFEREREGEDHRSDHRLPDELIDRTIIGGQGITAFQTDVKTIMTAEFHMRFVDPPEDIEETEEEIDDVRRAGTS